YSVIERLMANKALHNFLDGVTAGVVGLIGVTAIELFYSTITDLMSIVIFTMALITLIKFRSKYTVVFVILVAGLLSTLWNYFQ
ncbi:MAG TPA: chromate transporter, partial [Chitinophagaceae bacterium]|nr:chromate transporter [Chitinophagaceae bacterium]